VYVFFLRLTCKEPYGEPEMNLLMVTFDFPPTVGGIQTRASNYVQHLVKMKNDVVVVHLLNPRVLKTHFGEISGKDEMYVENFFGATVYRYPSKVKKLFRIFFKTLKVIKNSRIDTIHIMSGGNTPAGLLFLLYGKVKGLRTGVSFYGKDILSSRHNLLDILLMRFSMFIADKIGANSVATSRLMPKMVQHKITILYPGIDPQVLTRFKKKRITKEGAKEKIVLFVGRLVWRKSVHEVLQAFKVVQEKVPEVRLIIVGDGPQRNDLFDLAQKLGIQKKVEFTGTLTGDELWDKYYECDVFVMPSKSFLWRGRGDMEGFGMVFLEAGLFKKPSIGTWSGGIPEAVLNGKTGILIPEGDVVALKDAMILLLTNKDLAKRLGEHAYVRVLSEFTWEKATLRFFSMWNKSTHAPNVI
jgi:phosphatidylinositol alpha-1,6-mannosyltransferase